jgi:catechol 2,3-dioxygenase-like lactoylglutathione lyase family enzyme
MKLPSRTKVQLRSDRYGGLHLSLESGDLIEIIDRLRQQGLIRRTPPYSLFFQNGEEHFPWELVSSRMKRELMEDAGAVAYPVMDTEVVMGMFGDEYVEYVLGEGLVVELVVTDLIGEAGGGWSANGCYVDCHTLHFHHWESELAITRKMFQEAWISGMRRDEWCGADFGPWRNGTLGAYGTVL